MFDSLVFVIFLVVVALVFDFINGFHDSANSIATVVSTRVLPPKYAVIWAAFFNFAAVFFIGVPVAKTIGTGIINPNVIDNLLIFAALGAAIIWNLITWYFGLPSSSSHALIGGLIGAGIVKGGSTVLVWKGITKATLFIVVSPTIGMILGFVLMVIVLNLFRNTHPAKMDNVFRKMQLFSAATYSLGHGMNDAQKTMGIIAMALYSKGLLGATFHIPFWVVILCYVVIALGTVSGGWRIVKTMGTRITKLRPLGGFCAETAAAISMLGASLAGIPGSTTHTITGAIVGVGSTIRLSAVRWGIAGTIVWAWVLTIPYPRSFPL
jgi:PiT family inorganic phosphate transporter